MGILKSIISGIHVLSDRQVQCTNSVLQTAWKASYLRKPKYLPIKFMFLHVLEDVLSGNKYKFFTFYPLGQGYRCPPALTLTKFAVVSQNRP